MPRCLYLFGVMAAVLASFQVTPKSAVSCDRCSEPDACHKVCRLVCETKKIEVTCWGCKCEEFCVPGPSKPSCKHCDTVCEFCDDDFEGPSSGSKKFVWKEWLPGGAKVHTRKKLMKRTVTKTVPTYRWVVEDLCEKCEKSLPEVKIEPGAHIPPAPLPVRP